MTTADAVAGLWKMPRPRTETEKNWLRALLILLGSIAFFGVLYQIEMSLGRWNADIRMVRSPGQAAMHYLGISHFLLAFLYTLSSRRMRSPTAIGFFALMLALGILFCAGYARLSAISPLIASTLFFGYFLLHDWRDQIYFYAVNRDITPSGNQKRLERILLTTPFLAVGAVVAVAAPLASLGIVQQLRIRDSFEPLPAAARMAVAVVPAVAVLVALAWVAYAWKKEAIGSVSEFLRQHRPIYFVFGGVFAVTAIAMIFRAAGFVIVILHVTTWYVFITRQLSRAPADRSLGTWRRLRDTAAGFNVLHIGSVLVLVIGGALWAYVYRNDASLPLAIFLDKNLFPFWTILHVTTSFGSR